MNYSWIVHEQRLQVFMKLGSWTLVHEYFKKCLDACIFKNNLPIVHEQFMNLSSWTKYDCRSWIVHECSWIVHEYSSIHEFHFAWAMRPQNKSPCRPPLGACVAIASESEPRFRSSHSVWFEDCVNKRMLQCRRWHITRWINVSTRKWIY